MIVEDTKEPVPVGAGLRIHGECTIGHHTTWESCEFANKVWFNLHNYLLVCFGSKCNGATICPNFCRFFLFVNFFCVSLLFLLSFLISFYSSLLLLLILIIGTMLRLLILLFLYFKAFLGSKLMYGATIRPNFFVLSVLIFLNNDRQDDRTTGL